MVMDLAEFRKKQNQDPRARLEAAYGEVLDTLGTLGYPVGTDDDTVNPSFLHEVPRHTVGYDGDGNVVLLEFPRC